jgi:HEAT repeat protein
MQVLQTEDDPKATTQIVRGLAAAFDDTKVAQLLATALAIDGQASDRLATIFNTIAPDEERKERVMTLTRTLLSETDFGKAGQFQTLWSSMEELLVSYNDKPFVSDTYRSALDGVGGRAEKMATVELPPELPEWMTSLGQDSVRGLSVQLLIDLMTIETDAKRAAEIAEDMAALAEDLLMAGAYDDAKAVVAALTARASSPNAMGRDACRQVLDRLGDSLAMRDTVSLIGDVDDAGWDNISAIITKIGPPTVGALIPAVVVEKDTVASRRVSATLISFGKTAVSRLAPLVSDDRWYAQLAGANILGAIASPEAVPLLQPLLRKTDPRVAQAAVAALGKIDDPAAARAVQTVLRAATGQLRSAVMQALVADRDPRVVPMLARVIAESEPLGKDHDVVIETVDALATVGSDAAMPTLVNVAKLKKFFGGKKVRALKEHAVGAMITIGGTKATTAMDQLAQSGDRGLKKVLAQKRR